MKNFKETSKNVNADFFSLFENPELDEFNIDYLEQVSFAPPAPLTVTANSKQSDSSRGNLQRIQEKTFQLEKERRGLLFGSSLNFILVISK